jgi:hypothetical protein
MRSAPTGRPIPGAVAGDGAGRGGRPAEVAPDPFSPRRDTVPRHGRAANRPNVAEVGAPAT